MFGKDALERRVKDARSPRILHVATHGFFLEDQTEPRPDRTSAGIGPNLRGLRNLERESPLLRCGLAFSGVNTWMHGGTVPDEAEDGLLTAEDVTAMDLSATHLVVLSACETGLGETRTGEGVFGLRRAFTLAGARTLVMSLWKVPDEPTQELMVEFYRRLLDGQSPAGALRESQLLLKKSYPPPLNWGAFVCEGALRHTQGKLGSALETRSREGE
jgi:CHAT domain-containing protein